MGFFDIWRRNRDLFIDVFRIVKPHKYAVFLTSLVTKNYGFLSFWCQNGATEYAGCLHVFCKNVEKCRQAQKSGTIRRLA